MDGKKKKNTGFANMISRRKILPTKEPPKEKVRRVRVPTWLTIAHKEEYKDVRPTWGEVLENWRPSSIVGQQCDRNSVLKVLGYRGDPTKYNLQRIFEMGKYIELMWQNDFRKMGILVDVNQHQEKWYQHEDVKLFVKGEYDAKIIAPTGDFILVEIKSMASELFKSLPAPTLDSAENVTALQGIKLSILRSRVMGYLAQLQMYLDMAEVDEGLLLIDCKDDQRWKDYRIERDPDVTRRNMANKARLEPYRASELLPACTCLDPTKRKGPCAHQPEEEVSLTVMKRLVKR